MWGGGCNAAAFGKVIVNKINYARIVYCTHDIPWSESIYVTPTMYDPCDHCRPQQKNRWALSIAQLEQCPSCTINTIDNVKNLSTCLNAMRNNSMLIFSSQILHILAVFGVLVVLISVHRYITSWKQTLPSTKTINSQHHLAKSKRC
jgi:hypothetical protein